MIREHGNADARRASRFMALCLVLAGSAFALTVLWPAAVLACGSERWAVKTAADAGGLSILAPAVDSSISALSAIPPPSQLPSAGRLQPVETTIYKLSNVHLIKVDLESDQDYRLTVGDEAGHTMFVVSPDPPCATGSLVINAIVGVRQTIANLILQTQTNPLVTVSGVGFFNFLSTNAGQARNGIELHPLLSICEGRNCAGNPVRASPVTNHAGTATSPQPGPLPKPGRPPVGPTPVATLNPNVDPDDQPYPGTSVRSVHPLTASPSPSPTCYPHYRWPIKTLADSGASSVNLTPQSTTIAALIAMPNPTPFPVPSEYPTRISPVEDTTYMLSNVTLYSIEPPGHDLDYHVILKDSSGHQFITESPNPICAGGSLVFSQIQAVRNYINANFTVGSTIIYPNVPVTVTGVGFYDPWTGAQHPPSGLELHPLLSIVINGSPGPSPSPSPSASVSPSPSPSPSTGTPSPTPSASATSSPLPSPSVSPTATPSPASSATTLTGTVANVLTNPQRFVMEGDVDGEVVVLYSAPMVQPSGAILAPPELVSAVGTYSTPAPKTKYGTMTASQVTVLGTPTPTPSASATPGQLSASPTNLSFTNLTTTTPVTVSESNYSGVFNQDSGTGGCAGIVSVSPSSANGPSSTFMVTGQAQGTCTMNVTDDHGGAVPISITVALPSPSPTPSASATASPLASPSTTPTPTPSSTSTSSVTTLTGTVASILTSPQRFVMEGDVDGEVVVLYSAPMVQPSGAVLAQQELVSAVGTYFTPAPKTKYGTMTASQVTVLSSPTPTPSASP